MSEQNVDCDRFAQTLLEGGTGDDSSEWSEHLEACTECREQWYAHRILAATFADEELPALSPAFEAALERKLASAIEVRPLRGWRRAAMLAYAAVAAGLLGWALRSVPVPAIDLSAAWVAAAAFAAIPVTLLLAIAASRWIPGPGSPRALRIFAF